MTMQKPLLTLFVILALISCKKDPQTGPEASLEELTIDNYPKVDGSTSTQPLHWIIATELLGSQHTWQQLFNGTWQVSPNYTDIPMPFFKEHTQTHNSIINLIDKEADLILSARKMSADEKVHADNAGVTIIETPIALDAFIFVANPENPVNSLTIKQIQDIYRGSIKNWQEVGGKKEVIVPFVRNQNSGSQELMETMVMDGLEMPPLWDVELLHAMLEVFHRVRGEPNGLCYTVYYYKEQIVRDNTIVKTLAVDGVIPDEQTITDRSYPLVAEVYASIRSDLDPKSMAYKLYEYLQTEEGKRTIARSGYIPI